MVLEHGEYVVTHRYCHIPIDIELKDEDLPWIPINIPIMPLEEETEVYITSMSECGIVKITPKEKSDIELILEQ